MKENGDATYCTSWRDATKEQSTTRGTSHNIKTNGIYISGRQVPFRNATKAPLRDTINTT